MRARLVVADGGQQADARLGGRVERDRREPVVEERVGEALEHRRDVPVDLGLLGGRARREVGAVEGGRHLAREDVADEGAERRVRHALPDVAQAEAQPEEDERVVRAVEQPHLARAPPGEVTVARVDDVEAGRLEPQLPLELAAARRRRRRRRRRMRRRRRRRRWLLDDEQVVRLDDDEPRVVGVVRLGDDAVDERRAELDVLREPRLEGGGAAGRVIAEGRRGG